MTRSSACDTCEASAGCGGKHGKDLHIDVTDPRIASHKVGDRVTVEIPARSGHQAVAIGFGLPLLLFIATLLVMHYTGCADETAALGGIATLVVYYIILYISRSVVNRHFTIHLAGSN